MNRTSASASEIAPTEPTKLASQTVGNIGLYYVCYRLSRFGWNAMPTARNARGIDVLAYSQDGSRTVTVQVKALSKRNPVPIGAKTDALIADFVVIVGGAQGDSPTAYVLTKDEAIRNIRRVKLKNGSPFNFIEPKHYDLDVFREQWSKIGRGY